MARMVVEQFVHGVPVTTASTNGTAISNAGITVISSSGGTTHTLEAPGDVGRVKYLVSTTAATATTVTVTGVTTSTRFNAGISLVFNGKYTAATLIGATAVQWIVASLTAGNDSGATITIGTS